MESGAPDDQSRDLLGVFAIDGAVVVHNAFARVARDPGPPPAHITSALISYRLHRNALEIMHMTTSLPNDPLDRSRNPASTSSYQCSIMCLM